MLLGTLLLGAGAALVWPSSRTPLDCPPEEIGWVDAGTTVIAACRPAGAVGVVPAGAALTLGVKLDLNEVSEADLALLPGIGPKLAQQIMEERRRRGGFRSWDEVDAAAGVGPAKLATLMEAFRDPGGRP